MDPGGRLARVRTRRRATKDAPTLACRKDRKGRFTRGSRFDSAVVKGGGGLDGERERGEVGKKGGEQSA